MPGINLDGAKPMPTADELKAAYIDSVRLVSKADPNGTGVLPSIEQALADYKNAGIFALVVVTSESKGRLPANNHGWFQYGNEPTSRNSPSSMFQRPATYIKNFNKFSGTYSQWNWIAAGLADGDYSAAFWSKVAPQLNNCAGFAIHPYGKNAIDAVNLIEAHQQVTPDKLALVTEFNCGAEDINSLLPAMYQVTAGQYWFCDGDYMVPDFGLRDHPDKLASWMDTVPLLRHNTDPQPKGATMWVDASNYSGPFTDAMMDDLKAAGFGGVVVQAITGLNGISYTRQQLAVATRNGLEVAGYIWCFPGEGINSITSRLHMFDGFVLKFCAADVEQNGTTKADVDLLLDTTDAYLGMLTWLYSGKWFFDQQGWSNYDWWSFRPLWDSNFDHIPIVDADFRSYGGWFKPIMKQYWGTSNIGRVVNIDQDVLANAA